MRNLIPGVWMLSALLSACGLPSAPTPPPVAVTPPPTMMSLEAEPGSGDGRIVDRSRASGGQTLHLGPGERRRWTFGVRAGEGRYALSVTYSNGKEGENERLTFSVDGAIVSSFQDRDSGDATEGWNLFVTDPVGTFALQDGAHTLVIDVAGGDGCVEIDRVTLDPVSQ